MCGRYTLAVTYEELAKELGLEPDPELAEVYRPHYNIAPTSGELVLREHEGRWELVPARFGLVNSWAKDLSTAARQINARSETVREKPAFRKAFAQRRCIVPADGFYEWQRDGNVKTPFWFHPTEGKVLRFAGLYEVWKDRASGHELRTFAILTTAANDVVAPVHDRMPVILSPDDASAWLSAAPDEAFALLRPASKDALAAQRASRRVGNVRNQDAGLLREEPGDDKGSGETLSLFAPHEGTGSSR